MDLEALLEADRRGILPPDMKALVNEGRRRGLIPGGKPEATENVDRFNFIGAGQSDQDGPSLSNYEPTIRDRMGAFVQDTAREIGLSNQASGNLARGLTGSAGTGTEQMGIVDLVPGPSNVLAYQDAQRDFQQGKPLSGTLNTIAAGLPAGKAATNALRPATQAPSQPRLSEKAAEFDLKVPRALDPNPDVVSRTTTNAAGRAAGVPFVGNPLADKVTKGRQAIENRVAKGVAKAGPNTGNIGTSGDIIGDEARNWIRTISKDEVSAAYDAVKKHIPEGAQVDMAQLRSLIDRLKTEDAMSFTSVRKPVIDAVEAALNSPSGITIEGAEELRKVLTKQGSPQLAVGDAATAQPHFKRAAGALASDVQKSMTRIAGPEGNNAMRGAKFTYQKNKKIRDAVEKVLGKGALQDGASGEKIVNKLYSMAKATSSGDSKSLIQFRRAVGKNGWEAMRRSIAERMALDKSGEFSALKFSDEFKKLTKNGKRVMFGEELASEYTKLANVLQEYVKASSKIGNPSQSGNVMAGGALIAGVMTDGGLTALSILKGRAIMNYMGNPRVVRAAKNYVAASKNVMIGRVGPMVARTAARKLAIQVDLAGGDAQEILRSFKVEHGGRNEDSN